MKKTRSILTMLAVLVMLTCALATTAMADTDVWDGSSATIWTQGTGSSSDPYQISTGAELAYLAEQVNAGTDYSGIYFELQNDIVLNEGELTESSKQWTPIGTDSNHAFKGTFDGGGNTISGLYITGNSSYQGLFGYVGSGGLVTKVNVEGDVTGDKYIGGVVGRNEKGTVSYCSFSGFVTGVRIVGGVVGDNYAYSSSAIVEHCYNSSTVTSTFDGTTDSAYGFVGGVVGCNSGNATVIDCYNTGDIKGSSNFAGGVVGYSYGTSVNVENCYNTGDVSGNDRVGGVVGNSYASTTSATATVTNCYNTGDVTGDEYVAGVVGYSCTTNSKSGATAKVENCYNTGDISGSYLVGGVVGWNLTSYSDSSATVTDCYNIGTVSGTSYIGGVVGYNSTSGSSAAATTSNCYNIGTVSGTSYIGGVVGYSKATASNSTATASNCYNTGEVNGTSERIGGVVGQNYSDTSSTASVTTTNCYNTGTVNGGTSGLAVGGVVGYNYAALGTAKAENCVALCETVTGSRYVGRVAGLNASGTLTNNYAYSQMEIGASGVEAAVDEDSTGDTTTHGADLYFNYSSGFFTNSDMTTVFDWETDALFSGWTIPTTYYNELLYLGLTDEAIPTFTPIYEITFDAGNGTPSFTSAATGEDGTLTELPTASRSSYTFLGWYDGENQISTSTIFAGDTTVTATWRKKTTTTTTTPTVEETPEPEVTVSDDGSVTASTQTEATTENGTATATVDSDAIAELVSSASSSSEESAPIEVVVEVETDDSATALQMTLIVETIETVADQEDASFTVSSDVGTITLDSAAMAAVIDAGDSTDEVVLVIHQVEDNENDNLTDAQKAVVGSDTVYELYLEVNGNRVSDFGGGNVTVTVPKELGEDLEAVWVYYVDDEGNTTLRQTTYDPETNTVTFITGSFSYYMLSTTMLHEALAFTDVDEDDWFYDAVKFAVDNGITTGKSDTLFAPYDINTRAEAVTFLYRAMGEPEVAGDCQFTDLDADEYYYDAVLWADANGVTLGVSDTEFDPDATCTRAHIITFLWRMMGEPAVTGDCQFTDVADGEYYTDAVIWAVQNGITLGVSDTEFAPDEDCTRAEIVTFLYRLLGE